MMRRSVVVTIGSLNAGGTERRLEDILREARRRGLDLDPTIFIVSGKPGQLDDEFRALGAHLHYGRPGVPGLVDLWRLCPRIQPDVLHVNGQFASGFYALSGLLAGVRSRVSALGTVGRGRRSSALSTFLFTVVLRLFSTQVVGVAEATRKRSFVPDSKWRTIYTGLKMPEPAGERHPDYRRDKLNILVLGRGAPVKNHRRAIAILSAVVRRGTDARLHLVGAGTEAETAEWNNDIVSLGVAGRVVAHDFEINVYRHIQSADVLLLPSTNEGLPGVILEALSCGLPVVATDLGGVEEIAARTDGVTMLSLSEPDDAWAEALVRAAAFSPETIRSSFAKSPFTFEPFFSASIDLWMGAGRSTPSLAASSDRNDDRKKRSSPPA